MPSIIQLDLNPIPAGDRLTPGFFDYEDELMRTVAEYVKDDSDPEATLGEFQDYLLSKNPCVECFQEGDNRGICFREGFQGALLPRRSCGLCPPGGQTGAGYHTGRLHPG